MSTFILCPEPGISSLFRRMTAELQVFFSRNNLSYYSRWYTNPAGNLSVRVCMFRRGGVWTPCLYYRQGMHRNAYTGWYQPLPREVICLNRFTGLISRRRTWYAACRMAEQLTTLRYR
ncbi:hypothetical protein, partial [Escherichia marmotae]